MRIFSAVSLLMLAACGGPPDTVAPANDIAIDSQTGTPAREDHRVDCAVGVAEFQRVCSIERATTSNGTILTIRHPDGGFRRLLVTSDGAIAAADGAVPVKVRRDEQGVEVDIAGARYRLPPEALSPPAP